MTLSSRTWIPQRHSGWGLSGGSGGEGILSDGALSSVGVSTARTLYSLTTPCPFSMALPSSLVSSCIPGTGILKLQLNNGCC